MELTAVEARIVGCLIEKEFLTPDIYPMTTNALVTACNQKTNRDPVVSYDAISIDGALLEMRQRGIVRKVHTPGSRSTKHRHTLNEVLELDDEQIAVVSVLLLRGAQTLGELRIRTERQIGFDSVEAVESVLTGLANRVEPLVRELSRQPGQKENRWAHLLGADAGPAGDSAGADSGAVDTGAVDAGPGAITDADAGAPRNAGAPRDADAGGHRDGGFGRRAPVEAPRSAPAPAAGPTGSSNHRVDARDAPNADSDMVARVAELEREVATLRRQLGALADQLGEPLL